MVPFVTSMKPYYNFTVVQLLTLTKFIGILSLFSDKILIGAPGTSKLFIYSRDGYHLFTVDCEKALVDAQWTPGGNIVYIKKLETLEVVTESNAVIATHTHFRKAVSLSVFASKIIYLVVWAKGVYESTDDGISWNLVLLNSIDGWSFSQVIKVTVGSADSFWTLNCQSIYYCLLQVYKKRPDGLWVSANFTNMIGMPLTLTASDRLSYDGRISFMLSNWDTDLIEIFPVNNHCHLLSSYYIDLPQNIVVDMVRNLAYVASKQVLHVFKLKYEKECSWKS